MSKHLKIQTNTRLSLPILGTKKPERRTLHLLGISDSSFGGAKTNQPTRTACQPAFSANPFASRTADESISIKTSCKSFFNYFSTLRKNDSKAHEIRFIPIRARSIHPHQNPNNAPVHVKKLSSLLSETLVHPFQRRSRCFPETK